MPGPQFISKRKALFFLSAILAILLYVAVATYYLRSVSYVFILLPTKYEGKISVLFNQPDAPLLKERSRTFFVYLNKNGIARTSTSFINSRNVSIYLMPVVYNKNHRLVLDSSHIRNISNWYSGNAKNSLSGNREAYYAYSYNGVQKSAHDSLRSFLLKNGLDTFTTEWSIRYNFDEP